VIYPEANLIEEAIDRTFAYERSAIRELKSALIG
jgi:hypothetical protein